MRTRLLLLAICWIFPAAAIAQPDGFRVCTYNLLRFGGDDVDRADEFRAILNEIRPNILIVQEITTEAGFDLFRDSVANLLDVPLVGVWDPDEDDDLHSLIFYDRSKVTLANAFRYSHEDLTRSLGVYSLHVTHADSIIVVAGHLKAGRDTEDVAQRAQEALAFDELMEQVVSSPWLLGLPEGAQLIFGADFNIYRSQEAAYMTMTEVAPAARRLHDPIERPGVWNNNADFADVHTQSPRARQFAGGAHGGLDDRFDQILVSQMMRDYVDSASYTAFGNDGAHFNDSINAMPNSAVSAEIAQALHDASDHLPVFVDMELPWVMSVEEEGRRQRFELDLSDNCP